MTHATSTPLAAPLMSTRPFGLTLCAEPVPMAAYDVSGIDYDSRSQMSVRDGSLLVEQPLLDTAVRCTVTTREDMQAWTDEVTDA